MDLIETALEIALEAHKGQTDKAGETYILHSLRIMSKMSNDYERATALLHDVIEDSNYSTEKLKEKGIPSKIIDAVLLLTKNKNETYEQFIARVKSNKLAREVKKADIEDNINILRLKAINQKDLERIKKYHSAWNEITCT